MDSESEKRNPSEKEDDKKLAEIKKLVQSSVLNKAQLAAWKAHRELVKTATARVDIKAPKLIPELYMKSRILEKQNRTSQKNLLEYLKLLLKINRINRFGGYTDCWLLPRNHRTRQKLRKKRIEAADKLILDNRAFYHRLTAQQAVACRAEELRVEWKHTLDKIKLMGKFPFCLEATRPIDKGMVDPDFIDISSRTKYWMEFDADGGIHLGRIVVELFDKVCPLTCQLFRKLVKGIPSGEAYSGTGVFMIVPDMFCSSGDVTKNNGFGGTNIDDDQLSPENFTLNHSVPGVLSMDIHKNKINGIFNIIFRPMPFLNGRAVVFGRIVSGNSTILECLSGMGTPLGMTRGNPIISSCGWINSRHKYRQGALNTGLVS